MIYGLRLLGTKDASRVVGESVAHAALRRPASVEGRKPEEHLIVERGPALLEKLPAEQSGRPVKKGMIARLSRVGAVHRPPPRGAIRRGGEGYALKFVPKANILYDLLRPMGAVDVAHSSPLHDAFVDQGAGTTPGIGGQGRYWRWLVRRASGRSKKGMFSRPQVPRCGGTEEMAGHVIDRELSMVPWLRRVSGLEPEPTTAK